MACMTNHVVRRVDVSDLGFGACPVRLDVPLLDDYLVFLSGRCRSNTVLATAYDLKVFFTVVAKGPVDVIAADVLGFMTWQRTGVPGPGPVRAVATQPEEGMSARAVRRRLSSISGLFAFSPLLDHHRLTRSEGIAVIRPDDSMRPGGGWPVGGQRAVMRSRLATLVKMASWEISGMPRWRAVAAIHRSASWSFWPRPCPVVRVQWRSDA